MRRPSRVAAAQPTRRCGSSSNTCNNTGLGPDAAGDPGSYLLARLTYGDPFHGVPGMFYFPMVRYESYAQDARFMESLRAIQATGARLVLVHLAFYPEFKEGKEYVMTYQEGSLLRSLSEVTGRLVLETTKYVKLPVEQPERLIQSSDNYHPSLAGLDFYADAVAEMLMRNGVVR